MKNLSTARLLVLRVLRRRCRGARECSYQSVIARAATFLFSATSLRDIAGESKFYISFCSQIYPPLQNIFFKFILKVRGAGNWKTNPRHKYQTCSATG